MSAKKSASPPPPGLIDQIRLYIFGNRAGVPESKYKIINDGTDYDFAAHRTDPRKTNLCETVTNLVKGALGGGILGIHEAYMKAGLWSATIMCFFFAFYSYHCGYILTYSSHLLYKRLHLPIMSYPDVAEACLEVGPKPFRKFSRCFRYSIDTVIMLELFGACVVYLIIIAKTIKQLVLADNDVEDDNIVRMYIAFLYVPVVALGMVTTLKYIARVSMLGNVLVLTCVLTTVYYGYKEAPPISERPFFKTVMGFFEFCGVAAFSMECISISLSVENVMREPKKFPLALKIAYCFLSVFVITTGFFGYWGFGEDCRSPIHLNFPREIYPLILKFLMGIMILFTFAINFYVPFNLVWFYLGKRYRERKSLWERIYRFLIITGIFILAIAFPNIANIMGLIGAFCISLVVFIFPAIIELVVIWETPGFGTLNYILYKNIILMSMGFVLLVFGVYSNGKGLIQSIM